MTDGKVPQNAPTNNLPFEVALRYLKDGRKVKRSIWGGYWYLTTNVTIDHDPIINLSNSQEPSGMIIGGKMEKLIIAFLKDGQGLAAAQPYQQDLLAEDWQIVE